MQNLQMERNARTIRRWTNEEQRKFKEMTEIYRLDFRSYVQHFPGRTYTQIRMNYYNQLRKNKIVETSDIRPKENFQPVFEKLKHEEPDEEIFQQTLLKIHTESRLFSEQQANQSTQFTSPALNSAKQQLLIDPLRQAVQEQQPINDMKTIHNLINMIDEKAMQQQKQQTK
ncbi:Conserved_hypothetical protein [Hexamita inflata]|uniref:Myb-like domain-containing protein n=1 Tax=Hexamita inflata TaxID=28002 RepID=A0AA86PK84_9EUKA|nr:Conserved hypothetical protein [Hexamita inflata]